MLFLIKRNVTASLILLLLLSGLALGLRQVLPDPPSLTFSPDLLLKGVIVVGIVLVSDGLIHGLLWLLVGKPYRWRHHELAATFRDQTLLAILCGSLLAGVGEELIFRGLSSELAFLLPSAVVFGLLHHYRNELWPFTIWSIWQGILFAIALNYTGSLIVTMTAHFLHDVSGFLVFRYLNSVTESSEQRLREREQEES